MQDENRNKLEANRCCGNCQFSRSTIFPELITCDKSKSGVHRDFNWCCALFRKKEEDGKN